MSIPNKWYLRQVADSSSRACFICYKPTASVLTTPENKDFFYICKGHLTDRAFCSPLVDEEAEKKAAQAAKEKEIEKVKKEYEEKQRKKEERKKQKKKKSDADVDDKGKKDKSSKDSSSEDDEKSTTTMKGGHQDKPTGIEEKAQPRIFTLQKSFYQMRLDRIRNAEITRRNRERLKSPTAFPSVPRDAL
ncbi:MAG: hypothetical protein M1825_006311 [Sarcosagium campestre]|nr:MAG: hypothetical protein M1825_006311 [Sarcosagium campestre]